MWFNCLKEFLCRLGFFADCLFIYVDNIVVTWSDQSVVDSILQELGVEFALRELGELELFLGIQVRRMPTGLHLDQTQYTVDLLHSCALDNMRPSLIQ